MARIISKVRSRQPETFEHAPELASLVRYTTESAYDDSSNALVLDLTKCVECARCVRVCKDVQGLGIWKLNEGAVVPISTSTGAPLSETLCVSCGQCSAVCPSGALKEKSDLESVKAALKSGKVCVIQIAPSIRVAIGEEFGMPPGSIATGQLVMGLKRAGFHFVFDTNFAADLTIMEEGTEFGGRLKSGKGPFPMFSTCCPCWINHMEKEYHQLIPHMSTCKSPMTMLGALIKTQWAPRIGKRPEDIYSVAVMPCTAKKDERLREAMGRDGYRDIDYSMTTRECSEFLKLMGISRFDLSLPFDDPMGMATGAGAIFGASGGVMEAVLRTAADAASGEKQVIPNLQMQQCRGFEGIKTAEVPIAGIKVRVGVVHGLANIKRFFNEVLRTGLDKCGYHFVEIMACPGGCIGGGGQPHSNDPEILIKRSKAIYQVDEHSALRRSHENPAIMHLYETYLGKPNGHLSHELLHTHYHPQETAASAGGSTAPSAPVGAEEDNAIAVFYATVGGNTEGVARSIYNTLRAAKINAKLFPMDACSPQDLQVIKTAILLSCTFGDGERPPQAANVWDWLEGQQDQHLLANLSYAVFGLGSSKYHNFNKAAKDFDLKLEGLGAKRLVTVGLGDDAADDGFNTALEPWQAQLFEELGVPPPKVALVPHYRLCLCLEPSVPVPPPTKTMYATLTESRLATPPDYGRPIRYMEFELGNTGFEYNVGDALGIHPENLPANVDTFLRWYGVNPEATVTVLPVEEAAPLPIPAAISVRHLFVRYMDIFSRPRKLFFRQLANFARKPDDQKRLHFIASPEGAAELAEYMKNGPSYEDVLRDFPSAHPTLDFLVDMLPLIKPRLYSVASSPKAVGTKCQLVIAIPTEVTRSRGRITGGGLTTSWLPTIPVGTEVPVLVHEGSLRPPVDSAAPMLLVGLGTGLAPMRALLQDRLKDKREGKPIGISLFYQACRYKKQDFILQDEIAVFKQEGVLTTHIGAFSHDDSKRFETVDLLISENPNLAWKILKQPNAHYYYCGPAAYNIPAKIEAALYQACLKAGNITEEHATKIFEKAKGEKRWLVEAF
jgi:NADH-quinone oxidoreductase subunit G